MSMSHASQIVEYEQENCENKQETDLWAAYRKDPCPDTRNDLLMHYIGLVKRVVRRLFISSSPYHEYDDLYSCGVIGLMDAIDRFDPDRGKRFEGYAMIRIRGEIIDYMRRQDWAPVHLRNRLRTIQAAYDEMAQELGREPEDHAVAERLGMDVDRLQQTLGDAHLANVMHFEDLLENGESRLAYGSADQMLEKELEAKEQKHLLIDALHQLSEREQMILNMYYFDELTLREIGVVLGLSESRISQIHSKSLMRIRSRMQTQERSRV